VTTADLSRELIDYEERRRRDRAKLEAMIRYCQTAQCRTRLIREYFGEKPAADFRCGHCDVETDPPVAYENGTAAAPRDEPEFAEDLLSLPEVATDGDLLEPGEEVIHTTFGRGVVVDINGERAEVDFGGHGVRTVRSELLARS
jgi:ATP-dependent DNA helicase RecQ